MKSQKNRTCSTSWLLQRMSCKVVQWLNSGVEASFEAKDELTNFEKKVPVTRTNGDYIHKLLLSSSVIGDLGPIIDTAC